MSTTQSPTPNDNADDSKFNTKYLYGLLGLLLLCPLLYFCFPGAKGSKTENGDKEQTSSFDTTASVVSGGMSPREVSFVPEPNVQLPLPLISEGSSLPETSVRYVDQHEDSVESSESEENEENSVESSSASSGAGGTNDTFGDEAFSDDDDEILLRP